MGTLNVMGESHAELLHDRSLSGFEQFRLHSPQSDLISALQYQTPTAPMPSRKPRLGTFVVNAHAVNCGPRSALMIVSVVKVRLRAVISIEEFTSVVSVLPPITQPTALRE